MHQVKKPLIEKKRRERINKCLRELKKLVLDATDADVSPAFILSVLRTLLNIRLHSIPRKLKTPIVHQIITSLFDNDHFATCKNYLPRAPNKILLIAICLEY